MNFKSSKFTCISFASVTALQFLHIMLDLQNCCSEERLSTAPWRFLYPLLVNFCLQIAYRKVSNLQKVLISL